MVGTIDRAKAKAQPFAIQPSKSPDFKCVPISNVSEFQKIGEMSLYLGFQKI